MEYRIKHLIFRASFLVGVSLVGLFVIFCGLGIAFGSRSLSVVGFFSALAMLALLRLMLWRFKSGSEAKKG